MFKKIIEKYCPEKTITLYKVFRTDDMNSGETLNVNTDREIFGLTDRAAMQNLLNSIGVDKIASEIVEGVMEDWIAGKEPISPEWKPKNSQTPVSSQNL